MWPAALSQVHLSGPVLCNQRSYSIVPLSHWGSGENQDHSSRLCSVVTSRGTAWLCWGDMWARVWELRPGTGRGCGEGGPVQLTAQKTVREEPGALGEGSLNSVWRSVACTWDRIRNQAAERSERRRYRGPSLASLDEQRPSSSTPRVPSENSVSPQTMPNVTSTLGNRPSATFS